MTRAQLLAEVRLCIKRDSTGFADTYIVTRLDWAQEDLGLAYDWSEMFKQYSFSTTADTSTYSFPTRMKSIYDIRLNSTSGKKFKMLNARDFDVEYPMPSTVGTSIPDSFNDYGDRFELLPTPDDAYTCYLKCTILPATLSAADSTPDLVRKDRLIVALTTMYCFEALQEPELAIRWQKLAFEAFQSAMAGDRKPLDWTPTARPFNSVSSSRGQTWLNPFVKS